ncbi:hypothetical protein Belba_0076 [Belliella baltica DSM 15883]|uniref:Uncharacterized protein n=1 Tax=Belliella baltica (strain DSM 15883 / CIP 108006 / LMG 21964 / BA134) TaxID=866536 RepID=I3Z0H9_BELBD|nr:DUF5995 family protein [Belliella baltica]AFL82747.1 hypothetical protein Belba_0076 [Belliella baltica DSM 15883]
MKTIDDVILRMDQIVSECTLKESRIGYFAILYRQVTIRIKEGINNQEFEDNPRMEKLDVIFAKRFIDAYESYHAGTTLTQSWKLAFDSSKSTSHIVLQHLLLGINAHINLDLGIAAVESVNGQNIHSILNNFNKINEILSELVDGVKNNIGKISPLFKFLIHFAKGKDEVLVNFSIKLARDGAWKFANEYLLHTNKKECILHRDQIITGLAESMINPGKRLSRIIKIISFTEWKSVSNTMDQLNQITKLS